MACNVHFITLASARVWGACYARCARMADTTCILSRRCRAISVMPPSAGCQACFSSADSRQPNAPLSSRCSTGMSVDVGQMSAEARTKAGVISPYW